MIGSVVARRFGGRLAQTGFKQLRKPVFIRSSACSFQQRFFSSDEDWVVLVPPLGDSVTKGEVVELLKSPGDYVAMDEEMITIETDKVTFNVRAEKPGEIVEIYPEVDTEVHVGDNLLKMKAAEAPAGGAAPAAPTPEPTPAAAPAPAAEAPAAPTPAAAPSPAAAAAPPAPSPPAPAGNTGFGSDRVERREKLSLMRRRTAERLLEAQSTYALLTTFNEIDMSKLMKMRSAYKDQFEKVHGIKLGFMSAFVAASTAALQELPAVNAIIDDKEVVFREYCDISVAVSSPRGLVVPVLRDTQNMSFADIERGIANLGAKARNDTLSMEEMSGGTFTITNGGVFGSLMSTPMLNMPQSAILGMHGIKERPVTVNGEIVSRPMMYVALTYDHRLIDGRESVTFLKSIKEKVEDPERLLLGL